ncbi:1-deoxy-D-xylulose-5-phosphate reductoisomerase [Paenibacillus sp. N3/727]|uniref:1-deoxy-D-xylulose-5-phosphate reductoisomerase n=1 Tax=Paenibacillus sp. N3/727 TaxID=2925845 RepID=UPI001F531585|nr:1-deoxy-D-xylulose-5-phosphate reductoisomerase [Paenibacillus sp. N3/727]UNK15826.1 1-deoxy-D-xylulose-5-phosphate reductoisomerase [Paenibacillus sp. N3/727]
MKKISILGSTGSIGKSTLDVARKHPDKFNIVGLAANTNINLLIEQIVEFKPDIISVGSKEHAHQLANQVTYPVKIVYGEEGLNEVASYENADILMNSVIGALGIKPTIAALRARKDIAIANKETLVAAGHIVTEVAKEYGCRLIPVDSEHSAIFQCLNGENKQAIHKLILTASGGAFRDLSREEMKVLKAADALKHPNWQMGKKLTIDCATMMNKGFEVMEARWLFDIPYKQIEVLVHKESIIHSMVEFVDGSIMAQLGVPDMRVPIQYAFEHPDRLASDFPKLDFSKLRQLHFEEPDLVRFPCLGYAYEAGNKGGSLTAVLNSANEVANQLFLNDQIAFLDIERIIYETLNSHDIIASPSLDDIFAVDEWARRTAFSIASSLSNQ